MRKIFLIHDRQENPAQRKNALEMSGYSVIMFPRANGIIQKIQEEEPALVIIDVLTEGKNGFELCRDIRHQFPPEKLPIIMCTNIYRSRIYREEAISAGAQKYLLRPISPDELLREVSLLVEARAAA